jgi:hypothetical protein
VGLGAPHASTDWWDALVQAHPDVVRAQGVPAALRFFDPWWRTEIPEPDLRAYHAWFPRPPGACAGEWSPGYLLDPWTPVLLRRAAPEARLLVLLRDPVERFGAGVAHARTLTDAGGPTRAVANLQFQAGLYADQLLRLWRSFPRQQVLVLQLEQCLRDPRGELRRTFRFLALDPAPADAIPIAHDPANANGPPPLAPHQRAALTERYGPESRRLEPLVPDIDLSLWQLPA